MTSASTLFALDAGQTGTKVRVTTPGAAPIELIQPGVRTHEPLLPQLAETVRRAAEETHLTPDSVAAGVSGLTSADADARRLLRLVHATGARDVLLAHDSVTSFLGTLGNERGAVVAAGTGVVTLGVGRDAVARVDGWGNIMGDAGSGYWIGREALDAVMRAYDGRGAQTALTAIVQDRWPDLADAYVQLQGDPDRVRVVASFSQEVVALAGHDSVSARICLAAARELAQSAATALRRVGEGPVADTAAEATDRTGNDTARVSAIGGVFRSDLIRSRFEDLLAEAIPGVVFEAPHGTGLDGAQALHTLAAQHPLHTLVSVATV
ncbi:N-acetylglucosamine kinase [Microbacterium sp. ASV49]|uniref:BadF/BadG/BcrA/BcrD ATPase family protein n=1 Tax=Microbacterium candidum TaxID=3041922 RepID=A0ABT7MW86_9MICO|nr:BadF/BadG/BcrA/BcrD ATPase family protein [Microbacterium sp. ASV49]MDL9978708.1 BadF/BadG/BcrA/BcrD ATPase family protein [Microbacterium sp. ASV49]